MKAQVHQHDSETTSESFFLLRFLCTLFTFLSVLAILRIHLHMRHAHRPPSPLANAPLCTTSYAYSIGGTTRRNKRMGNSNKNTSK